MIKWLFRNKERFYHVSYHFQNEDKSYGFGYLWINCYGNVSRKTIEGWADFIKEQKSAEIIIILFFKEIS